MSAVLHSTTDVRYRLPLEQYHSGPAISNSGLSDFARSPAHYYAAHLDPNRPPEEETPAQLVGNLAHCATLEPAEFSKRYATAPASAPRRPTAAQWNAKNPSPDSVAAMEWWRAFMAAHAGATFIDADKHAVALAQAASVRKIPDVAALLESGRPEVSAFWTDPATGEFCRCRPDWVHETAAGVILLDLKTCGNAAPREFARQVARMGYHRQAAFYSDGYTIAADTPVLGFVFVAVECEYPYAASAVMLDDESLAKGRAEIAELLRRFAECRAHDAWPGYGATVQLISLPAWALATTEGTT